MRNYSSRAVAISHGSRQNNSATQFRSGKTNLFRTRGNIMSSNKDPQNVRGSLRLAPASSALEVEKAKLPRQFVNFTFYKARPEWRLLSDEDKQRCREGFTKTVDEFRSSLLIHSYSTIGLRTNVDFIDRKSKRL